MNHLIRVAVVGAVALLPGAIVLAQKTAIEQRRPQRVQIGHSLTDAKRVFRASDTKFSEGGFAFTRTSEDSANLHCKLDEDHNTSAAIFYSKSKKTITGISVVFGVKNGKMWQVWKDASSITFHEDGSYAIHFLPLTPEQKRPPKADEFPPDADR